MNKIPNQNSILWKYQNPVIVYYHMVSEKINPYYSNKSINPDDFRKQVKELKNIFNTIALPEAIEKAKSNHPLNNSLVITIDDGFTECYSTIAPILSEEKIPATFFLIENCIDNQSMMWMHLLEYLQQTLSSEKRNAIIQKFLNQNTTQSDLLKLSKEWNSEEKDKFTKQLWDLSENEPLSEWLQNHQPYLTTNQIKELVNAGFTIGSHSSTHPSCDQLSYDELQKEIEGSCLSISNKIGIDVQYFSYPFGRRANRKYEDKIIRNSNVQCLIAGKPKLFRRKSFPFWEAYNLERKKSNLLYYLLVNSFSIK